MATESVKILIEAEDAASAKIANASKAIEANVKRIKDVGGQAKASTEFIGQLAGQLGGSELASFASQMGGLTEKVGQFAEVSKAGGAGALAFKAGVAGLVAVLAFEFGKSIGNAIFQTEEWSKALEKAHTESKRLTAELIDQQKYRRDIERREIALLPEEDQASAQKKMLDKMKADLEKYVEENKKAAAEIEKSQKAMTLSNLSEDVLWKGAFTGGADFAKDNFDAVFAGLTGSTDAAKAKLEDTTAQISTLRDEIKQMERATSETEKSLKESEGDKAKNEASKAYVASLREQLALEKAVGDERMKLEAQKTARGADVGIAADLLKQIEAERMLKEERKKAEDEQKKMLEQEQANRKKIIDLLANENMALQERAISIEKGKEAAKAFKLEQQGIAKADAERIAAREAELDKLEKAKQVEQDVNKQMLQPQEAFQSRFLSRGPLSNPNQKLEEEAAKQTKLAEDQKKELERLVKATEARVKVRDVRLEVVE